MRFVLLLALPCLAATLRRKSKGERDGALAGGHWKKQFDAYMTTIMATDNPKGINDDAHPYASEVRTSRGLAILQHGFTSSPGFWYLLAPRLAEEGWDLMVPCMPGHGRAPKIEQNGSDYVVTDYTADLPVWGAPYEDYTLELMEIIRMYKKENPNREISLVGWSHGGGVAAYMGMNMERGIFDRVLLMEPFLAPPTGLGADYGLSFLRDMIPKLLPDLKPVAAALGYLDGDLITWGDDCNRKRWPGDPRRPTTGGICQFTVENFRGVLEFGNNVEGEARERAAKLGVFGGGVVDRAKGVVQAARSYAWNLWHGITTTPSPMKVQVVATENDGSVSNARIHFAAQALQAAVVEGNSALCAVSAEMEHTFINPPDKPVGKDMWWLDANRVEIGKSGVDILVDFISDGVFVPSKGVVTEDSWLEGDPKCDMHQKR